jgi:cysteine synthase A
MESLNPGGTGKDRAALGMISTAEAQGLLPTTTAPRADDDDLWLRPCLSPPPGMEDDDAMDVMLLQSIRSAMTRSRTGGLVVEGTSGSTGIALATLCVARGHSCLVLLPDDQAVEKQAILRALDATVRVVPTAAISNPHHYVNLARRAALLARDRLGIDAVFMDQFDNPSNFDVHRHTTGPELWRQMGRGDMDAFVMSSGTGGTLAGVATFVKQVSPHTQVVLVDPPGSSLYHKVEHGVAFAMEQQEQTLRKHRYDTLAEGIGLDRVTRNFELGVDCIDRAMRVSDQEAVDMAHWILRTEGLWIGSSSAMNLVGAIRTALELPKGSRVVTMVCDGGQRHVTRFWNPAFIQQRGLRWPEPDCVPQCIQSTTIQGDSVS